MISFLLSKAEALANRHAVKQIAESVFRVVHCVLGRVPGKNRCPVCGALLITLARPVMSESLVQEWDLALQWVSLFNQREGEICISCGASMRVRQLAAALLPWLTTQTGESSSNVRALAHLHKARLLRIAEVNSCGALHKMLATLPGLAYSEYQPDSESVRHEDLMRLSYSDKSFDLVIHSDSIEHVPDVDRALAEIWRVLKPGGATIFTAPVVRDGRKTRVRARLDEKGEIEMLLPPSYHGGSHQTTQQYLVFYELGDDFCERVTRCGFELAISEHPDNPAAITFIATKAKRSIA